MSERVEFLERGGLFQDLTPRERQDLQGLFQERRLERDEIIFLEGEPAEYVYLVYQGKVKIVKQAPAGCNPCPEPVAQRGPRQDA